MKKIDIPDTEVQPIARLCWAPGPTLARCDREVNHGPLPGTAHGHTWEVQAPPAPDPPPSEAS